MVFSMDSLCSPIHVDQRPPNLEILLDDFSNSDFCFFAAIFFTIASSNCFQITAKAGNYIVPRILEVRGVIAPNYVSEFHSKLKANSKWKTQPVAGNF